MEQLKEDIDCFDPDTAPTLSDEVHVTHTHVINDDLRPIGTRKCSVLTRVFPSMIKLFYFLSQVLAAIDEVHLACKDPCLSL